MRFPTHRVSPVLITLAAGCLAAACADSADCGEGQMLEGGSCVASVTGGDGGGDGDGNGDGDSSDAGAERLDASDTSDTAAGDGQPSAEQGFGDPCTDDVEHSECMDVADYCAIMPGGSEGSCTATGCAEDEAACPEGWGCLDLSIFDPELPSICTAP